MSLQKKNVIQEFMKDDYIPTSDQFLVKYSQGKGNNLHEVECVDGSTILVSMPKKYRHTVWLKKEDCLVIHPIEEGKKVKGEIVCVLTCDSVRDLVNSRQWPSKSQSNITADTETLLKFFNCCSIRKSEKDNYDAFPSTDSSDLETDEDEDVSDEEEDEDGDDEEEEDGEDEEGASNDNTTARGKEEAKERPKSCDDLSQ